MFSFKAVNSVIVVPVFDRVVDPVHGIPGVVRIRVDLSLEMALQAEEPLWDQVCFHAQQAAEKSLKALLVSLERDVPRTHDLVFLLDSARDAGAELVGLDEDTATLTQYGVSPRYPTFLAQETKEDANGALRAAKRVMEATRTAMDAPH